MNENAFGDEVSTRLMDIDELRAEFKRLRRARNQSQASVAERLGITQASLSAWETGKNQSLRAQAFNRLISLVDSWTENNIVPIPVEHHRRAARDSTLETHTSEDSREQTRERMIREIRARRGSRSPAPEELQRLPDDDLLDIYTTTILMT